MNDLALNMNVGLQANGPKPDLPPKGRRASVRYQGGQCLAYVDASGTWRNYDNGDVLREKILSWQLTEESTPSKESLSMLPP